MADVLIAPKLVPTISSDGRRFGAGLAGIGTFTLANTVLSWVLLTAFAMTMVFLRDRMNPMLGHAVAFFVPLVFAYLSGRGAGKAGHAVATAIAPEFTLGSSQRFFALALLAGLSVSYFAGVYAFLQILPMAAGGCAALAKGDF